MNADETVLLDYGQGKSFWDCGGKLKEKKCLMDIYSEKGKFHVGKIGGGQE